MKQAERRPAVRRRLVGWVCALAMPAALGNTVNVSYLEGRNPAAPDAITAYGDDLFGERVNLFNGSLSFEHLDLSLPGNSELPVALARQHQVGRAHVVRGQFGDWDLDVPRIGGSFSLLSGWISSAGDTDRCSGALAPPAEPRGGASASVQRVGALSARVLPQVAQAAAFQASEFWQGIHLSVPGHGSQEVLQRASAYGSAPTDGGNYPLVTRNNWQIRCLPTVQNAPGQGFLAVSPQGVRYRFDWMAGRSQTSVKKTGLSLARQDLFLMATQVSDRFGNWVRYTYDPANPLLLTRIESNDGRVITVTNSAGRAVSASDGSRSYGYRYGPAGNLSTVTRPDGSRWEFDLTPMVPANLPSLGDGASCDSPGDFGADLLTGRITHPSGAQAVFTTQFWLFGRTGVDRVCWYAPNSNTVTVGAVWPRAVATQALTSRQITGPGLPTLTWQYQYNAAGGWSTCVTATCSNPRWVTVTEPSGTRTRHTFGSRWRVDEGLLLKREDGWDDSTGAALRTTTYRYRTSSGQAFPEHFGASPQRNSDWVAQRNRPLDQRVITLQGSSFTWEVDSSSAGFDAWARPLKVRKSSSLGPSRLEATTYADHTAAWVLGQLASTKELNTNLVPELNVYDPATALRVESWSFGRRLQSFAYNADGTLAAVFDPANRATRLSRHLRGQPQTVQYADGTRESQVINNLGLADSRTNAVGGTTRFSYDAMGRVSQVTPPGGDTVSYHPTVLSFEPVAQAEYGLPPGHWRQTVSTGNARTLRYFDALWRERLKLRYDVTNPGGTAVFEETRYDTQGRPAFGSYPERSFTAVDAVRPGRSTRYDAIGRVTLQRASSELGSLDHSVSYPADGYRKVVTNPRGLSTTYRYQAFDEPREDLVLGIASPEGVSTSITRDLFGKATQITRSGASGGSAAVARRTYVYDPEQRLCKTVEPESGATVQAYDAAGQVAWRATGLALPSASSCDADRVPAGRKISFSYDQRDRLVRTTFGDGSTPVGRTYTDDGLPLTLSTDLFSWTLGYNNARLLVSESLSSPLGSHTFSYGIDAHRQVASMSYPGGPSLAYAPDAFGRPTQVSGYASNIGYHPDGQLSGYTAANGIAYSMSLSERGLPLTLRHAGVVQDRYSHDANGNVSAITDLQEGLGSRTMAYDGLDRLTAANGSWGTATYAYDALDNLVGSRVGARSLTHTYDPTTNRLTGVTGTLQASVAYDANGNLVQRAGQVFSFDIANRLTAAAGVAGYYYDGHGRRAGVQTVAGRRVLRIYSQSGQLLLTQDTVSGVTRHIHLAGRVIAEHHSATGARWLHTDALGSPVAVTGVNGTVLERTRYEPYGLTAAGANRDGIGFTGHVNDVDTGLVYMQQRYYDPIAGRFLSVDPVTTNAKDGSYFNRYVYAASNPYRFKDPDGRAFETAWDIASLALSVREFAENPNLGNAVGVAIDAAAVVIPGFPGGVGAFRAASHAADGAASLPKMQGMGAT